jgi:DNA adenine methylase
MARKVPGAKSAMGAAEQIISMMPAHRVYLEGFGGTGAIYLRKRPAAVNIIIEKDGEARQQLAVAMQALKLSRAAAEAAHYVIEGDVFDYAAGLLAMPDLLAYFDPPYVMATRKSQRAIYRHEFCDADHERLGAIATDSTVRSCIMVSGYAGSLYAELFRGWRREDFSVMTRGGPAIESVWCNFDPPAVLHDARFVGKNFTDRQRIQRKAKRWVNRLLSMPPGEKSAVLQHIQEQLWGPCVDQSQARLSATARTVEYPWDGFGPKAP